MFEIIRTHFRPLVKYATVGSFVTGVNFSLLTLFVEWLEMNPTFSSGLAYVISAKLNYFLQYHLTFKSERKHHKALVRYWLVAAFTTVINVGIFWVLNVPFGIYYLYSQIVAIGTVFILNFFLHHHFTFGPD